MSRKLQVKQDRRRAEERRKEAHRRAQRRGNLTTIGIALAVAATVIVLVVQDRNSSNAGVGGDPSAANCTSIQTHPIEGNNHVSPGTTVHYDTNPPTSGNHYATPADPGFYSGPVASEALVHNLEHGQIVIWYNPGAPQATIDALQKIVTQQPVATLAAPWDNVDAPYAFTLTAWGASQSCQSVSQEVVDRFRERFQGHGPQQVGVPVFTPTQ